MGKAKHCHWCGEKTGAHDQMFPKDLLLPEIIKNRLPQHKPLSEWQCKPCTMKIARAHDRLRTTGSLSRPKAGPVLPPGHDEGMQQGTAEENGESQQTWIDGLNQSLFPSEPEPSQSGEDDSNGEESIAAAAVRPLKPNAKEGWAPVTAAAAADLSRIQAEAERAKEEAARHRREKHEERERMLCKAKKRARNDLSMAGWSKHQYYRSDIQAVDDVVETVPREHCDSLSVEDFIEKYDKPQLPVVIDGLQANWDATEKWDPKKLLKRFPNVKFKVGADDAGYPVRLSARHFMKYVRDHNTDDSPLYAFDSKFADRKATRSMRDDYEIPDYWKEDLFKHCGEKMRPPYRWFVMGPARSGSGIHIDPLATSAWNALIFGRKRWVLFPPDVDKNEVDPKGKSNLGAIEWFDRVLPAIMRDPEKVNPALAPTLNSLEPLTLTKP